MALVADLFADLLGLISIENSAHADPPTLQRITDDINKSLQRIFTFGPREWTERETGARVFGPTSLTGLTLSNGLTTISGAITARMHGCVIAITGDPRQNELRQTAFSTFELAWPYLGATTAAGTAIVYGDAVNLDYQAVEVIPPVYMPPKRQLYPMVSPQELFQPNYAWNDYDRRPNTDSQVPYFWRDGSREVTEPTSYLVEQNIRYDGDTTIRIRLNPLPNAEFLIRWRQRLTPPRITGIADSSTFLIPHRYIESILQPVARYFFSMWPQFTGDKEGLLDDYNDAMSTLKRISEPQQDRPVIVNTSSGY